MRYGVAIAFLLPLIGLGQMSTVVGVDLDSTTIRIGEQVGLRMHISYSKDAVRSIEWPTMADTLNKHVEVIADSGIDTVAGERGAMRELRVLTITSFDTGYWAIPPFRFLVDGNAIESSALLLEVKGVALDSAMVPRDIKDIHTLPFSITFWLREHMALVAGGLGVLALIAALLYLLLRRKKEPGASIVVDPTIPAHERALTAMRALEHERIWQQGDHKGYHSRLTDILRGYIEERFMVPALESTTDELIKELRVSSLSTDKRDQLENMLRLADLVKFAKSIPSPQENEQMMSGAIRFVESTAATSSPTRHVQE